MISDEVGQREYAKMILQIGNGNVEDSEYICFQSSDPNNFSTPFKYKPSKCFILQDKKESEPRLEFNDRCREAKVNALRDFYPQGFQSHKMHTTTLWQLQINK